MKIIHALAAASVIVTGATAAHAATDVVEAPNGYFVPDDSQKNDWPYYRWIDNDWGWQHGAITESFTTASLNISAFDVDADDGEADEIRAFDGSDWVLLGVLDGNNDIWAFTTFDLDSRFFDEIATGLKVMLSIDVNDGGWAVTLGKSTLTTDGADPGNPTPGIPTIPEPASWAMLIAGFGLVGTTLRRRRGTRRMMA